MNEQALKERIKYIAQSEGRFFNQVWKDLILERFLVRLAYSSHKDQFIFKGGLLLSHYIQIWRETKDIDFLAKDINSNISKIETAFQGICQQNIKDGFNYTLFKIEPLQLIATERFCFRLNLNVSFGTMKDRVQLDIAGGDVVEVEQKSIQLYQYKGKPMFEKSIVLKVCPAENIFAEKLESIVSKMDANTRMKDYHDIFLLCSEKKILNASKLKEEIIKVFKKRGTKKTLPIQFSEIEVNNLQKLWEKHTENLNKGSNFTGLPVHIKDVISEINNWLLKNISF